VKLPTSLGPLKLAIAPMRQRKSRSQRSRWL
jgi:hypothetical protein